MSRDDLIRVLGLFYGIVVIAGALWLGNELSAYLGTFYFVVAVAAVGVAITVWTPRSRGGLLVVVGVTTGVFGGALLVPPSQAAATGGVQLYLIAVSSLGLAIMALQSWIQWSARERQPT